MYIVRNQRQGASRAHNKALESLVEAVENRGGTLLESMWKILDKFTRQGSTRSTLSVGRYERESIAGGIPSRE